MPKVTWLCRNILYQILYALQQCKNFENRLRFDKVVKFSSCQAHPHRHRLHFTSLHDKLNQLS